jgi:hypothetical protein
MKKMLCPLCKWRQNKKCRARDGKIPDSLLTCLAFELKRDDRKTD